MWMWKTQAATDLGFSAQGSLCTKNCSHASILAMCLLKDGLGWTVTAGPLVSTRSRGWYKLNLPMDNSCWSKKLSFRYQVQAPSALTAKSYSSWAVSPKVSAGNQIHSSVKHTQFINYLISLAYFPYFIW